MVHLLLVDQNIRRDECRSFVFTPVRKYRLDCREKCRRLLRKMWKISPERDILSIYSVALFAERSRSDQESEGASDR